MLACENCAAGKSSGVTGAASNMTCVDCVEGRYSLAGASACLDCTPGSYSSTPGAPACVDCPAGETSIQRAVGASSCFLPEHVFNNLFTAETSVNRVYVRAKRVPRASEASAACERSERK